MHLSYKHMLLVLIFDTFQAVLQSLGYNAVRLFSLTVSIKQVSDPLRGLLVSRFLYWVNICTLSRLSSIISVLDGSKKQ